MCTECAGAWVSIDKHECTHVCMKPNIPINRPKHV